MRLGDDRSLGQLVLGFLDQRGAPAVALAERVDDRELLAKEALVGLVVTAERGFRNFLTLQLDGCLVGFILVGAKLLAGMLGDQGVGCSCAARVS